jgi:hypothetical protein
MIGVVVVVVVVTAASALLLLLLLWFAAVAAVAVPCVAVEQHIIVSLFLIMLPRLREERQVQRVRHSHSR